MIEKPRCCASVPSSKWRSSQCSKTGKIEREGKYYCAIHDPVAVKAKNEKWHADWKLKHDAQRREFEEATAKRKEMERRAGCFDELTAALNASAMELAGTKASSIARQADLMAKNAALKDQARQLLEALTMVRDADEDCKRDGLKTLPPAPRAKIDAAIENWKGGQPCTTN
jgi:uncharacterized Zn finger protein (UPF0148 family)